MLYQGIEYEKGQLHSSYKYKAYIPKSMWNARRPDKIHRGQYKIVSFGKPGYQQYYDKLGMWSKFNHHDKKRRSNYRARHGAIYININGESKLSYKVPYTKEWFSWNMLW